MENLELDKPARARAGRGGEIMIFGLFPEEEGAPGGRFYRRRLFQPDAVPVIDCEAWSPPLDDPPFEEYVIDVYPRARHPHFF